jgi:hypothetical protein
MWVMVGHQSLVIWLLQQDIIGFQLFPGSRSRFFFTEIHQDLCVSHIVILLTFHPARVKTVYKRAAPPPLLSSKTLLPRVLYFCIKSWWTRTFLFPRPRFILLYVHKRGCGFLATM